MIKVRIFISAKLIAYFRLMVKLSYHLTWHLSDNKVFRMLSIYRFEKLFFPY